ncbi:Hypothetical predicted protein [Mytilus galloprovincialis]|uniref:Uncharacterized protein n=1 Tax=Mytilus galloprovincialis TaxID=29158 RepID=A0A8B6FL94_MYTGA|nr:Hypothetical predicted protein [Mytilus galloprovincialis]
MKPNALIVGSSYISRLTQAFNDELRSDFNLMQCLVCCFGKRGGTLNDIAKYADLKTYINNFYYHNTTRWERFLHARATTTARVFRIMPPKKIGLRPAKRRKLINDNIEPTNVNFDTMTNAMADAISAAVTAKIMENLKANGILP